MAYRVDRLRALPRPGADLAVGLFDGILGGLGWIWDNTVGAAANALWDQIVGGLVDWVVSAIAWFVKALLQFFERSSTPNLTSNWFSGDGRIGPHAQSPYGVIAWLSLSLLLACVLVGIVQGLLAGEGPAMAARIARDVPLAILGIVATVGVVQVLLGATDELAHAVLDGTQAGANAKALLQTLAEPAAFSAQASFVVFLLGLVAVVGSFLLWIELLIRASLIYLLLAIAPLAYAAFVWPAARRVLHRLAELVVALVFSKLVIAIALAVAASALTRGPSASGGVPTGEQKVGTLLVGVIMFCLASFAPFLLLKLLPVVEGAVVAQGISRSPVRTAQSAAQTSFYVARLAGTGGAGAAAAPAAGTAGNGAGGSGAGAGTATRPVPNAPARSSPDPARSGPSASPSPGRAQSRRLDLGGADRPSADQP
jgi:hypothetical protein